MEKGLIDRFLDRTEKDDNECWIWTSVVNKAGLPLFTTSYDGHYFSISARRFCWEQIKGERLVKGIEIHLSCSNRLCVNPDHLYLRTQDVRFTSNYVEGLDDECWNWIGHKNEKGYGMISYNKKPCSKAHRVMWERTNGKIPEGMHVLHHCDNPSCVNPKHLFLGTHKDNMKDMTVKGRSHRMSLGKKPLTEQDIKDIRRLYKEGKFMRELAMNYEVSESTIGNIVHNLHWTWVSDD